jgi:hypothetical protein
MTLFASIDTPIQLFPSIERLGYAPTLNFNE